VPRGSVTQYSWTSKVYPGTVRDYWVYVPAQYDVAKPACVMIFQDGGGYVKEDRGWWVPVVFDNLIEQKAMPVYLGLTLAAILLLLVRQQSAARVTHSRENGKCTRQQPQY
jgi:enterochelin esterase-like enzyme